MKPQFILILEDTSSKCSINDLFIYGPYPSFRQASIARESLILDMCRDLDISPDARSKHADTIFIGDLSFHITKITRSISS